MHLRARARAPARAVSVGSTHEVLALKLHLFTWSVKSDSCYNVPWLCSVQTQTCTSATTSKKNLLGGGGGGVVRLTAKPRYLLLLHRGKEKSNTVTALHNIHMWPWTTKPVLSVNFSKLRFIHHMKAEYIIFQLMYGLLWYDNIWLRSNYLKIWNLRVQKNRNIEKIIFKVVQMKFLAMHITNQKLSLYIFMVGNLLNIFMEHDLYLIS